MTDMTPEERARRIKLAHHDYAPNLDLHCLTQAIREAENAAIERAARISDNLAEVGSIWRADRFGRETSDRIRALKHEDML